MNVDDVFTGVNSIQRVIEISTQLTNLLATAGFKLCKWCSKENSVLQGIPLSYLEWKLIFHYISVTNFLLKF